MSRRALIVNALVLLCVLGLLRVQLVGAVDVPLQHALELGLACGVLGDLALTLLVLGIAAYCGARRPGLGVALAIGLSIVLVGFTTANVAYFDYFDARLAPWVITSHLGDLPAIWGSVRSVLGLPALLAGVAGIALCAFAVRSLRRGAPAQRIPTRAAALMVAAALALVTATTAVKQRIVDGSSILAEQVFVVWVEGELGLLPHHELARRGIEQSLAEAAELDPRAPGAVLAAFRDWQPASRPVPVPAALDAGPSLVREHAPDPARTHALRARLGLPAEGPLHVVVLFLESVRAFELEHPDLWPQVFPRTRALLARQALRFPTAYASAPDVGKTVQGQFATLCSMLPNFNGAAAYTSHPYLRVKSMAEVARDRGYHTLWISGGKESFHNKRLFESLHGTQEFYGYEVLRELPYDGTQSECGYPDGPMLQEAVRIMERAAQDGRPVFANILTLSTHHPVSEIAEGPVPEALLAAARNAPASKYYPGYLSRLSYLDRCLEPFFDALFGGPLGERTLVVLLGDHGQRYKPHLPVAQHQVVELMARIPFAFVTKHPPQPGVVEHPVHQIDVAPTVADVAGWRADVAWIGRNVLEGPGSPWVVAEKERLHYRVRDHACYTLQGDDAPTCYRIDPGVDPLFSPVLPAWEADPQELRWFQSVAVAARQAITLNRVMLERGAP